MMFKIATAVQCVNLRFFLPLRFYVKLILADFRRSETAILTIFEALIFNFFETFIFENVKNSQKCKIQGCLNGQSRRFRGFNSQKLILRKILVAGKF